MNVLKQARWSPVAVGAALGVLSWVAFASAGRGLGITSPFEQAAAFLAQLAAPSRLTDYLAAPDKKLEVGWEWAVVVGVFLGALLSSTLSRDRATERIPQLWRRRFGDSEARRLTGAFAGGLLMMVGARFALGCTSGHGITGALQLAVSSWAFLVVMFGAAVLVAKMLFGRTRSTP